MFHQVLNPTGNLGLTVLVALIPVIALLVMLTVFRITAWLATVIGSVITLLVAILVWQLPFGALVCFGALLLLLKVWRPKTVLGYGGVELDEAQQRAEIATRIGSGETRNRNTILAAFLPFLILIVIVVLWTGPWSPLPKVTAGTVAVKAVSSISHKTVSVSYPFAPFIGGTAILFSWLIMLLIIRPGPAMLGQVFRDTFRQMWGALLVGIFIFGLAFVFNYSGMGASLAYGFSKVGPAFILLAPILGWIGVALSGSNTSTNTLFGLVQVQVGRLLGFPLLLLPSLNSVGAEVGKPVAPQTASVGVSTSKYVRDEGQVIRHNMGWTLVLLGWLIIVGLIYYFLFPGFMK